ncbi:phosphopantetheinyl transferase [Dyadobacter jejuensis]|uniref:Phosphopantetheinyl transferase n=1 Tax=Dyadobacter jejuensis TaxID=1082580 RepID=A0A316ABA2_9BACT|nr:4'-phosphopantetheinyl transferase superfamily protein [Dyadobacter jejuensis]PWJ54518.1 phosphopantetheinyl transferase [Dyadobacter jejuensis]
MPLVHSELIDNKATLFLWELTEDESELRRQLHHKYNMEELEAISHPQKIREWLASRLLLQLLAQQQELVYAGTQKDEHGKAFLINHNLQISLTHTQDYVAAILGTEFPVGIDMERLDPKLQRTAHKFLTVSEYEHAEDDLRRLGTYWCAKEAVYKLYGKKKVSFKDQIYILPFSDQQEVLEGELRDEDTLLVSQVYLRWIGEYCMAIAL